MGLVTILSIDMQHNSIECDNAECRDYLNVVLIVVMLSDVRLSVIRLNAVMLRDITSSIKLVLHLQILDFL